MRTMNVAESLALALPIKDIADIPWCKHERQLIGQTRDPWR
jgi:hypothetical protein